ncbi:MAG TPA: amidohydrolase family protein [Lacipirellulaceae bacterium]|jgi:cytosine/adenosine deaminase-related metal-dependent hydrolase|nr:amidohydrolase family protein [Lacipirellulaceae bacterium]
MSVSLQARFVFPVDRPPIEHGVVMIEGERIVEVGSHRAEGNVLDLGDVALLPGLVNAHTHLEFSHLRKPLGQPGIAIVDWIRLIIAERARADKWRAEPVYLGQQESLAAGVTTVGDIVTNPGATCITGIDATFFQEVIGFSRARAESSLNVLIERLEFTAAAHTAADFAPPTQGISPHAPYTVSPLLLRPLVTLAHRHKMPVAMHLAESREELQFLREGNGAFQELLAERSMWDAEAVPRGSTPHDYLRTLVDAPRALVIHGNYLDDDELDFLGTHRDRMSLVYCPRTHAYFKNERYPLATARKLNVRIALGTDSRASNPDLSLLSEMRYVAAAYPTVDPNEVLRMGTLAGAEALGREHDIGSLAPGKLANIVAVPLRDANTKSPNGALEGMLADDSPMNSVWLHAVRTRSGSLPSLDVHL